MPLFRNISHINDFFIPSLVPEWFSESDPGSYIYENPWVKKSGGGLIKGKRGGA